VAIVNGIWVPDDMQQRAVLADRLQHAQVKVATIPSLIRMPEPEPELDETQRALRREAKLLRRKAHRIARKRARLARTQR
jgi:hypothetical protein